MIIKDWLTPNFLRKKRLLSSASILFFAFAQTSAAQPTTQLTLQENETSFCEIDGDIDSSHSGYTGSGYANTDNSTGSSIKWSVVVAETGAYIFQWRFANGKTDIRSASIIINGADQATTDFNSTGSWSSWQNSVPVSAFLEKGYNEIRAEADTSGGLPNIDNLTIRGAGLSPGDCSGSTPVPQPSTEPTPAPTPTPTTAPTATPTLAPTATPTAEPTTEPTATPTPSPEPTATPEPTPTPDPIAITEIQEEENGFCGVDGSVDNNNSGFTGTGFANTDNATGKGIDWRLDVAEGGNYNLEWRFANGSTSNRSGSVIINETEQASVDFNGTGSWTSWENSSSITVYLAAGYNTLRLNANTSGGLPNIDKITIIGGGVNPGSCSEPTPEPTATPEPTPTAVPTPTPEPTPTQVPTPTAVPGPVTYDTNVPMGWAVVPGYGIQTTTGGAGGEVVTATSHGQLSSYLSGDTPRIVKVQGTISGGDINVGSNKTIIGVGSNATLRGFYLNMNPSQNVIIRNLEISGGTDAIAARYTDHLWIDHVHVHRCGDGLIDLTRETDMYTVSWTLFSNHRKTMLLNGGSRHYGDRGKLNGTIHHNYFNGTNSRNPRAGFGKIHIFNDYNYKNGYAIGFHTECKVLAERNYFENTSRAIHQMYRNSDEQGDALAIDNVFDNASGNTSTGIGFDPTQYYLYDFVLDEAAKVRDIVKAGAGTGAEYGEIGLMPIPGQGSVGVSNSTLSWKTGTQSPNSYVVYFGTSNNPPKVATTSATSYNAGSLNSGQIYYWRVDQVTSNGTIPGKLWLFKAQ